MAHLGERTCDVREGRRREILNNNNSNPGLVGPAEAIENGSETFEISAETIENCRRESQNPRPRRAISLLMPFEETAGSFNVLEVAPKFHTPPIPF